jgi:hypothetical protein
MKGGFFNHNFALQGTMNQGNDMLAMFSMVFWDFLIVQSK